jgi:hypothetical protein
MKTSNGGTAQLLGDRRWGLKVPMLVDAMLRCVLRDEALTRGLMDPEARLLIEWLVEQVERLTAAPFPEDAIQCAVNRLRRRARAVSRFVSLWCYANERGAAIQLAAAERFKWPLPCRPADPCGLMERILSHEVAEFAA